jgi:seryl-tRNA synthetase
MLDIAYLRRDLNQVIERLQTRKLPQPFLNVDTFQSLENERKTLQTRTEELQAKRNSLSKTIGQLKAKGESADAVMAEVGQLKDEILEHYQIHCYRQNENLVVLRVHYSRA